MLQQLGAKTTHDNTEVAHKCDVIFLATKPPLVAKVASEIAPSVDTKKLVISIALGITIRNIESVRTGSNSTMAGNILTARLSKLRFSFCLKNPESFE